MKEIRTVEVKHFVAERVQIKGWLHNLRHLGGISFLVLRDGWGTIQAVTENEEDLAPLAGLALESVIALEGIVVSNVPAPGGFELHQPQVKVITPVHEPAPLSLNKRTLKATLPTLLDHAVIAHRHPARQALFRLAAGVMAGFRSSLTARHFVEVQTPKIVASATEGGSNVFELNYFGRPAYLAQSRNFTNRSW